MKRYSQRLSNFAIAALLLAGSCKKDEAKVYYSGGTAPVLTASASGSIALPVTDTTATAVTFNWTNPNYQFSDGISSMSVTYYLQFDTLQGFTNQNFPSPSIASGLSTAFTVAQLNALLTNGMLLDTGRLQTIYVRVESSVPPFTSGTAPVAPLYSNALSFKVKPYGPPPAVVPPKNDSLYIVGSAVADNWANPISAADVAGETFTRLSHTHYQLTTTLTGGQEYKLINVNGSWTDQWSVSAADTYPNGGPFVYNGGNCIAPTATGTYLIDVNFQTGKFTVTAH
jgi:hypothetical protein